jgi:hypothetical protein
MIWSGGSKSIIPGEVVGTLDRMAHGRWFIVVLIRIGLPRLEENGSSKVPEGRRKRRN